MAMKQGKKYTIPIIKHFFLWKLRRKIRRETDQYFQNRRKLT